MNTVALIVGSLRKGSFNKTLALNIEDAGKGLFSFVHLPLDDLPLYNQDHENDLPEAVARFKQGVEAADAVIFVTPEYNRSIPGVLKNALDWASRPWGHNSWSKKPAAVCGVSPGAVGTAAAQSHLRGILTILNMPLLSQPEVYISFAEKTFTPEGGLADPATKEYLTDFLVRFKAWVEKTK